MRLPFAPLREAVGTVMFVHGGNSHESWRHADREWQAIKGNPTTVLSELTGYHRRTLDRWVRAGIPEMDADRIAISLGLHPSLIWDEWFGVECPTADVECGDEISGPRDVAKRPGTVPTTGLG